VLFYLLKYVHDGIVQLREHHEVDRKAGAAILSGRVTGEPGQCIVLLQNEPAKRNAQRHQTGIAYSFPSCLFWKIYFNSSLVSPGDSALGAAWLY